MIIKSFVRYKYAGDYFEFFPGFINFPTGQLNKKSCAINVFSGDNALLS